MTLKILVAAFAVLLSGTAAFAQSLPNYGPNAPASGDSFGKPFSGAQPLRNGARAYAWRYSHRYHHRHYYRHKHHRRIYE
jgi:hypothetical protein